MAGAAAIRTLVPIASAREVRNAAKVPASTPAEGTSEQLKRDPGCCLCVRHAYTSELLGGRSAVEPVGPVQIVDRVNGRHLRSVRDLPAAGLTVAGDGAGP